MTPKHSLVVTMVAWMLNLFLKREKLSAVDTLIYLKHYARKYLSTLSYFLFMRKHHFQIKFHVTALIASSEPTGFLSVPLFSTVESSVTNRKPVDSGNALILDARYKIQKHRVFTYAEFRDFGSKSYRS